MAKNAAEYLANAETQTEAASNELWLIENPAPPMSVDQRLKVIELHIRLAELNLRVQRELTRD